MADQKSARPDVFEFWALKIFLDLQKEKFFGKVELVWQDGRVIRIEEKRVHLPKQTHNSGPTGPHTAS